MKKIILTILIMLSLVASTNIILFAQSNEDKYEYHDSSWYLSAEEATAFMGFIYNLAPEDLPKKEFASLGVDLLTGKYAESPEDEYILKMTFCEVALTLMNNRVDRYDHASVITSENLINWLKAQVGENPEEQYINSTCNGYLNKIKESIKKTLLICNLSDGEYEAYENFDMYFSGFESIIGIPKKVEKYTQAMKAGVEAVLYAGSSSRSAMYKYFLSYVKTRDLANSTVDGFELAMNYNVLALSSQGLYDPFLNWAAEDNQKVLNRWAELFYWLMKDIGEVEFTNNSTSGTTTSTLEPVEFVPGTGTYEGTCGKKVKWHLDASTGVLNIYGEGSMDNYTSASKTPWYNYRKYINFVRITDGVISIGNYAFAECTTLDKVYLAADVYNIGDHVFYNCLALRLFVVDGIVNNIGKYTFYNCKSLVYFDIPERMTDISDYLFYGCTGLVTVDWPTDLVNIGNSAFNGCTNLTTVGGIPSTVTTLGERCFSGCTNLTDEIVIPEGVTNIGNSVFYGCSGLTGKIVIQEGVTTIGSSAFKNCSGITEVFVSESVTEINESAFAGMVSLKEMTLPFVGKNRTTTNSTYRDFAYIFGGATSNIPTTIEKVTITDATQIPDDAFENCSFIKTIVLPDSVTKIGSYAFYGCSGLTGNLTIPNSVTSIGNSAFYGCSGLTGNLIIPNSVTSIGNSAFSGCTGITSITIPDSVTYLGQNAFKDCVKLVSAKISNNLEEIQTGTFNYCTSLEKVVMPISAKISNVAHSFYKCTAIDQIIFTAGNGKAQDYSVYTDESSTYYKYTPWYISGCSSIVFEEGVVEIGERMFWECEDITDLLWMSNTITTIDDYAFCGCSGIKNIFITDLSYWCNINFSDTYTNPLEYAENFYCNDKIIDNLVIPSDVEYIGEYSFAGYHGFESVIISDSVRSIGKGAFERNGIKTVVFGDNLTKIGEGAFSLCINLKTLKIGSSVKEIESGAFLRCSNLNSVEFPVGLTSIGSSAFFECDSLSYIEIPNSVTSIGYSAFSNCDSITDIALSSNLGCISDSIFMGCESLSNITIPDSVTNIESFAFASCYALTDISIPNSVTSIGDYVFDSCYALTNITIPNSVTSIGDYVFNGCDSLTSITIPHSIKSIGYSAFPIEVIEKVNISDLSAWCSIKFADEFANPLLFAKEFYLNGELVEDLIIPYGIINIEDYAFSSYYCDTIKTVTIPGSVKRVGKYAFNIYSIKTINYTGTREDWCRINFYNSDSTPFEFSLYINGEDVGYVKVPNDVDKIDYHFQGCKNITGIKTSSAMSSIGKNAFYNCDSLKSVIIQNGVTSIGTNAFRSCDNLTTVTIPDSVLTIAKYSFSNCSNLRIKCSYNSVAHLYAIENDIPFVIIDFIENTASSKLTFDYDDGFVYGIENSFESLDNIKTKNGISLSYDKTAERVATGTKIDVVGDDGYVSSYTAVIFGDVDGDGWYNGMDATIVQCLANGMLTKDDVGEAVYMAADCNHDGVINEMDVALLNQAGLLFANIDQTKSEQELVTNSEYIEYLELIDQNPDTNNDTSADESETVIFTDFTTLLAYIFEFIKKILSMIFTAVI